MCGRLYYSDMTEQRAPDVECKPRSSADYREKNRSALKNPRVRPIARRTKAPIPSSWGCLSSSGRGLLGWHLRYPSTKAHPIVDLPGLPPPAQKARLTSYALRPERKPPSRPRAELRNPRKRERRTFSIAALSCRLVPYEAQTGLRPRAGCWVAERISRKIRPPSSVVLRPVHKLRPGYRALRWRVKISTSFRIFPFPSLLLDTSVLASVLVERD